MVGCNSLPLCFTAHYQKGSGAFSQMGWVLSTVYTIKFDNTCFFSFFTIQQFRKLCLVQYIPLIVSQCLESLQAQEKAQSKRHSTSELETITFSDVCKDGWLHYKQILKEKGKVQHIACTHCNLIDSICTYLNLIYVVHKNWMLLPVLNLNSDKCKQNCPTLSERTRLLISSWSEKKKNSVLCKPRVVIYPQLFEHMQTKILNLDWYDQLPWFNRNFALATACWST